MATGQGIAVVDFGTGANEASVTVVGQTSIGIGSKADAFIMADDTTTNHSASDHRYFAAFAGLTCGTPSAGSGFTIYATSQHKLTGQFSVRWIWAD